MNKRYKLKNLLVFITVLCLVFTLGFLTGCSDGENGSTGIRDIVKALGLGTPSVEYDLVISELNADNFGAKKGEPEGNEDGDDIEADEDKEIETAEEEDIDGAKVKKDAYHIIANSNNGGSITGDGAIKTGKSNFSVPIGTSISFTVIADEGYYIEYIRIGNGKTYYVNMMSYDISILSVETNSTIHAHFKKGEITDSLADVNTGGDTDSESTGVGNNGKGKGKGKNK